MYPHGADANSSPPPTIHWECVRANGGFAAMHRSGVSPPSSPIPLVLAKRTETVYLLHVDRSLRDRISRLGETRPHGRDATPPWVAHFPPFAICRTGNRRRMATRLLPSRRAKRRAPRGFWLLLQTPVIWAAATFWFVTLVTDNRRLREAKHRAAALQKLAHALPKKRGSRRLPVVRPSRSCGWSTRSHDLNRSSGDR